MEVAYTDFLEPPRADASVPVVFSARYQGSISDYTTGVTVAMIVTAVVTLFIFFMRISSWRARNANLYVDGETIVV
jgi:hypothetical protein